jgi:predicted nucleic acid-binding protein
VPALVSWHPEHGAARRALADELTAIPAHVLLESFSVLTRLPAPHRIAVSDAATVLDAMVDAAGLTLIGLPAEEHRQLVSTLATQGVRGGAVYDGLVAATARHHDVELLTRDRRARATYDALGVRHRSA